MTKRLFLVISLVLILTGISYGWVEEIDGSWGLSGLTKVSESSGHVDINLSLGVFGLEDFIYEGNTYQRIIINGVFLPADKGAPDFPSFSKAIAIPQGARARIEIIDYRKQVYHNVNPVPAPELLKESDISPLTYIKDEEIYNSTEVYPSEIATVSDPYKVRGVDAVIFGIIPFQWDPVSKDLTIYTDIRVRVVIEGGNGVFGEDRLRTRNWDRIFRQTFMNYAQLPEIDYSARVQMALSEGRDNAEYVIIIPDDPDFIQWADSIKKFRSEEGVITEVFTLTDIGGTSASVIEAWVDNAYNTWTIPPEAILILSDYPGSGDAYGVTSPNYTGYLGPCVSDNIYGSIASNGGGDSLPDIVMGRICAQTATHLHDMIMKGLIYERTPPTVAGFYDNPVSAVGYQSDRWFQIAGETVRGFWTNILGKAAIRVYAGGGAAPGSPWSSATNTSTVVNYFNALGYIDLTIPAGINWNATTQDVVDVINNGTFIIQHRDHGSHSGWSHPSFNINDLSSLTNTDTIWPFVYSTNCLTGEYDYSSEVFAEAFHRAPGKGFLGVNAASATSYSFVNDTYIWGNYDYMWPFFMPDYNGANQPDTTDVRPAFAMTYAKHFLAQSSWPYNQTGKQVTYHLFHHHGDPYMRLFSNVPQTISVTHPPTITAGLNVFPVSAPLYSYIALTVDGVIIGRADGTGTTQNITIDPQNPGTVVKLVVTMQDHYRYEVDLDVIPSSGAYVAYAYTDTIVGGYNNGQVNGGESYDMTLAIANWGSDTAYDVYAVLTASDVNITIDPDTLGYGDVAENDTVVGTSPYQISIAGDTPDGYSIPITMTCWDTYDSIWTSSFYLLVNAPILSLWTMMGPAEVLAGDNFYMWPKLENEGSGTAYDLELTIRTDDSYGSVTDSTENMSSILPGDISWHDSAFQVSISASTPEPYFMDFEFEVQMSGGYSYFDTITVGIGSVIFSEDFEDKDTADWTYTGSTSWHLTEHDSLSPTHSMYCGQEGTWKYANSLTNSRTMSPQFTVGAGAVMFFWHRYDIETSWEGAQMQITTNSGSTWTTITPDEGYTGASNYGYGGYNVGDPFWTGHDHTVWEEQHHTFTISGDVNVCWRFGSDGSVTYEGYYFDDVLVEVESGFSGVEEELTGPVVPAGYQFALHRAYPNPVRGRAMISYSVGSEAPVRLIIYDVTGREVSTLVNQVQTAGNYKIEWDGRDNHGIMVSSGTYFYRMTAGGFSAGEKIVVVR